MDAVTVIETALVAGGVAGVKDTATMAVKDAYAGLKARVLGKVQRVPGGEVAVEQHEQDPETWQAPLRKALESSGATQDEKILDAARTLLELADPDGAHAGRYTIVTASGERSVAVGGDVAGNIVTGEIQR